MSFVSAPGKRAPTLSDEAPEGAPIDAATLRATRAALVEDHTLRGLVFGWEYARAVDSAFTSLFEPYAAEGGAAVVALGSYARRELCPGSDIDVMLLHDRRISDLRPADALWYPFWDADFDLGHSTRSVSEAVAAGDDDLDSLTAMLDARHVAGDPLLTERLVAHVRSLAVKRRKRILGELSERAAQRALDPGPVAEMLEPDLKAGFGGLRDVVAPRWSGWTLGAPGGTEALVAGGYLEPHHPPQLSGARERLLDVRVALHRVTGSSGDRLTLQEQDAVAEHIGSASADDLIGDLSEVARAVVWITSDCRERLASAQRGPLGRLGRRDKQIDDGVILRDRRVVVGTDIDVTGALVLRVAAAAAQRSVPIDRATLERLEGSPAPDWTPDDRDAFLRVLRAGRPALSVFESLDHYGLLVTLFPEWNRVRSRPQRNAYHRFTIDRHLLEAVTQCAELLDPGPDSDPVDARVAANLTRPELLLLAALLHDIGKGGSGDHSERGAAMAATVCRRIGLDIESTGTVVWLVLHHLLLADTATRRDLAEETTIARVANLAGTANRLRLLYLLTIGDSLATGAAAWGQAKAALVRELFVKASVLLERGEAGTGQAAEVRAALAERIGADAATEFLDSMPTGYSLAFEASVMERHRALMDADPVALEMARGVEGLVECTVVAPDRVGLLSLVAGVLAVSGFVVREAAVFTRTDGVALEVFRGLDRFDRFGEEEGVEAARDTLRDALAGDIDLDARVSEHVSRYHKAVSDTKPTEIMIDLEASDFATVVEVRAGDRVGLLYNLTAALTEIGLDVTIAKVATLGEEVIDTFYVVDPQVGKFTDAATLERVHSTLERRVASDTYASGR